MRIFLTGGTGFIGSHLVNELVKRGDQVTVITRGKQKRVAEYARRGVRTLIADPAVAGGWQKSVNRHDAVINLAGESIASGRWTDARKKRIRDSRVNTTRNLVEALASATERPSVLVNASAIGYYGYNDSDSWLEESSSAGKDFLAKVVDAWEAEAMRAEEVGVRVVLLRIGIVLGADGGAISRMLPAFRLGLGGPVGNGLQWYSWIHVQDLARLIVFSLDTASVRGAMNATAPGPVRMKDLARSLGRALHRPALLPVPGAILRFAMGEMSDLLLRGQRVRPAKALAAGFNFKYPQIDSATAEIAAAKPRS